MGILRWPLVVSHTLLWLCVVRLGAGIKLSDELDSLLCPSIEEKKGKIIDVHKSLDLGAELLDGSWESSLEKCISECCHKPGCDLALYKNEGVSQSGKNCYYIKCLAEDNCVMVDHSGFTSVLFRLSKNGNTGDSNRINGNERTGHHPPTHPTLSNKAPPTTTTATPTQSTKGSEEAIDSTTQQPAQSHSDSNPSSTFNSVTDSSDHTSGSGETPPTKSPSAKAGVEAGSVEAGSVDKSALNQGKGRDDSSGERECGRNGCDGSGVIAIAVVASICFIIIVLVVAVLLKKVITDNRRRRFKNVDYLINGMYT